MDPIQAQIASADTQGTLGVWIQPGLGQAIPSLKDDFQALYRERIASLPFIPLGWLSSVQDLQAKNPTALVKLFPSKGANGKTNANLPAWLTADQARIDKWQQVVDAMGRIQYKTAEGLNGYLNGDPEFARIMSDAAFWNEGWGNTLINVATAVRDAPGAIVGAVGDGALSVLKSFLTRTWYLFAIAGVAYLVWANRGKIARKAADKAGSLL